MWWYNILGDNKESISHILRLDPITEGSILITAKLVALKRENCDTILIVKRTEWRKFIDDFGQSIEANPSSAGKNEMYSLHIGYIPIPSSVKIHISSHHLDKYFSL